MDHVGINIPGVMTRRKFIELMEEAGVKFISLEELLLLFTGIVLSTSMPVMAGSKIDESWMFWGEAENAALSLVPLEVRYEFVLLEATDRMQTRLSS